MENLKGKAGIYIIKNIENNKFYIGSSYNLERRIYEHKWMLENNRHENKRLQNAYNKYGKDSFIFEVLEFVDMPIEDKNFKNTLLSLEQVWLDKTNSYDKKVGYNILPTAGSNLGYKQTQEHKDKISKAHKGKNYSKIFVKGMVVTPEMVNKIKEGIKNSKKRIGRKPGYIQSEENKRKISKGLKNSEKHAKYRCKIINLDTLTVYNSITEAGEKLNIDISSIAKACKGRIDSAGGYRWRYIDKDNNIVNVKYIDKRIRKIINIETKEVFKSITEAANKYNIVISGLSSHLKGNGKTSGGYHWQYYEDYLKDKEEKENKIYVHTNKR